MEADHNDTASPAQSGKTQSPSIVRRFLQLIGVAAHTGDSNERSQFRNNVGDLSHFDRLKAELAKQRDEQRGEPGLTKSSEFENPSLPAVGEEVNDIQPALELGAQSISITAAASVPQSLPESGLEHCAEPVPEPIIEQNNNPPPEPALETVCLNLSEPIQMVEPSPTVELVANTSERDSEPSAETLPAQPNETQIETPASSIAVSHTSPQAPDPPSQTGNSSQLDEALEEFERKRLEIQQALNQPD